MKPSHIEHIGIAVKNLQTAIALYEKLLGVKCYAVEEIKDQKVRTAFFRVGETKIELLEPTNEDSPVSKFIEKRGEGIHHVAFAVDNIEEKLSYLEKQNFQLIDKVSRKGAEGLNIAFIHPKSTLGVLTEICEDKSDNKK